jgi:hypothetical protein
VQISFQVYYYEYNITREKTLVICVYTTIKHIWVRIYILLKTNLISLSLDFVNQFARSIIEQEILQ